MHPQFGAMLCFANGISVVNESVWDGRFKYVNELQKMGATIYVTDNRIANIMGNRAEMHGAAVGATDLRAGAALVIAALAVKGESTISGVEYINRGYYDFVGKLRAIGADITLIDAD